MQFLYWFGPDPVPIGGQAAGTWAELCRSTSPGPAVDPFPGRTGQELDKSVLPVLYQKASRVNFPRQQEQGWVPAVCQARWFHTAADQGNGRSTT